MLCKSGNYLENDFCYECPSYCVCDNQTYCTSCIVQYFLNDNGHCQNCPSLCICENSQYCSSCVDGAVHDEDGNCEERCGDLVIIGEPCDLELGIENDGCTDNCEIEQDFDCYTESSESRSVCSFNGNLSLKTVKTSKELFSNQLTVEFQLSPDLYVFQSVSPQFYLSFDSDLLTLTSFSYNKESSTFSVSFSYT